MNRTIEEFGAQWTRYPQNSGYYASQAMFEDICSPLLQVTDIRGKHVADLGSGSGRIVSMLLELGAAHITAVEPSDAFHALKSNTARNADRITYVNETAERLPGGNYDLIISIGVIHHIPDPGPVIARAYEALGPGGRCFIWVYGREGNELYLSIFGPLRRITRYLPDIVLVGVSHLLTAFLSIYIAGCKILPLPMRDYMRSVLGKYGWHHRFLTIFDQLNPTHARYYRENEARGLLARAGFTDVKLFHRHGYSWSVLGAKSA